MATVARKGIVCEHCNKFLDFSYGTESATGVLCLYCRGYVEIRDDLLVTLRMEKTNMAETQHTPGPWTIDHERIGPPGEPVALLCDTTASTPGTVVEWPRFGEVVDDAENEANARLIASAPALLEALEDALADLEGIMPEYEPSGDREHPGWQTIKDIKEAIAKAKGVRE